jgi:hypothetical protein
MVTLKEIGVYDSGTKAAISINKPSRGRDILDVCGKKPRHAYGYYWELLSEEEISKYPTLTVNIRKQMYENPDISTSQPFEDKQSNRN